MAQGPGAELVFLILACEGCNLATVAISGLMVGVGAWTPELFAGNLVEIFGFDVVYLVPSALSGAILADLLVYSLVKALAVTGALDRFAIG